MKLCNAYSLWLQEEYRKGLKPHILTNRVLVHQIKVSSKDDDVGASENEGTIVLDMLGSWAR